MSTVKINETTFSITSTLTMAQLKADHDAIIAGIEVSAPAAQTTPENETAAQ